MDVKESVIISIALVISCAIIFTVLIRFKMKFAAKLFIPLMGILLCYIPFFFGGYYFTIPFCARLYTEPNAFSSFCASMYRILSMPLPFMQSATIASAIIAFVMAVAAIITIVYTAYAVVQIVKKYKKSCDLEKRSRGNQKNAFVEPFTFVQNDKNIYLRLCRLLN